MAAPYPFLSEIVEAARIKLNDAIIPGGDVLTDTASFTIDYVNLAWQKFQQFLVSLGYVTLVGEQTLVSLAAVGTADAAIFPWLSWTGYNNGAATDTGVVLPQLLIRPLLVWERPVGTGKMYTMDEILNGLPAIPKGTSSQLWEWREDKLYFIGATVVTDLRIRFAKYLENFVADDTTSFSVQPVQIMRSTDAFSGFLAYEMCFGRGDVDGPSVIADAKEAAAIMVGLDSSVYRNTQKTSEGSKMRDRYTPKGTPGAQ